MKKQSKIKRVATKKLFYKKWLYKVVLQCAGISYLHRKGIDYITNLQPRTDGNVWLKASRQEIINNKANLIRIGNILELLLPMSDHQIRVESSTCGIFTNDLKLVKQLESRLNSFVTEVHEPSSVEEGQFLLDNKNKVLCKELPLDGYKFRVYFKNTEMNATAMSNFLTWADKYNDGRIHIPKGTRSILEGSTYPYFYGQYFYARDQKIASMALMVMGEHLNKTEEFVLKSDVNA